MALAMRSVFSYLQIRSRKRVPAAAARMLEPVHASMSEFKFLSFFMAAAAIFSSLICPIANAELLGNFSLAQAAELKQINYSEGASKSFRFDAAGELVYVNPLDFVDGPTTTAHPFCANFSFTVLKADKFSLNFFVVTSPNPYQRDSKRFIQVRFGNSTSINIANTSSSSVFIEDMKLKFVEDASFRAWIEFKDQNHTIEITIAENNSKADKPAPILVLYTFDLAKKLKEKMYVGFNANGCQILKCDFALFNKWEDEPVSTQGASAPTTAVVALGVLVGFLALVLCIAIIIFVRVESLKRNRMCPDICSTKLLAGVPQKFTYRELSDATNGFSQDRVLGRGGFGGVYKGSLSDGSTIAVKRISEGSKQGEREFKAEISVIGKLRHRNLVPLRGWCKENKSFLLVYEYMPNGSLDKLLFGTAKVLDWKVRYNSVKGVASALAFLHHDWEKVILHRDVKLSNVILDGQFRARLGDFGLARMIDHRSFRISSSVSAAGTMGYLPPESSRGRATVESDTYGFGVLALEMATGRKALDSELSAQELNLVDWVWKMHECNRLYEVVDPRLQGDYNREEMRILLLVGLFCTSNDPQERLNVRHVYHILSGDVPVPELPLATNSIQSPRASCRRPRRSVSSLSYLCSFASSNPPPTESDDSMLLPR